MADCQKTIESENNSQTAADEHGRISPRIIVQGGGYSSMFSEVKEQEYKEAIKEAARKGYKALFKPNGTAVDAVEAAVRVLEDNKQFNAGRGSYLNHDGEIECDAMIMEGHELKTGAVMAVRNFSNPVSLSRAVMEDSYHCALAAEGALEFAQSRPEINKFGFVPDPMELHVGGNGASDRRKIGNQYYDDYVKRHYKGQPVQCYDTVSAVAMDANGHLACATSTGGIPGKLRGRVGDAPLVGCGGYANKSGAATTTGHGESIMKVTLAREVVYNMERGQNAQESAKNALKKMQDHVVDGYGGIIAIDRDGNFGKVFNTVVMGWASIKDEQLQSGMKPNESENEQV